MNSSNMSHWEVAPGQSFSGSATKPVPRSILKKKPPPSRQPIAIAYIRDCDAIFYRTPEMLANYEQLQRCIFDMLDEGMMLQRVPQEELQIHTHYLMRELLPVERFHRVVVTQNYWNLEGCSYIANVELVDVGEQCTLVEGLHEMYILPYTLNPYHYPAPTIADPCIFNTDVDFDRDAGRDDPVKSLMNLTTLRNLLPVDQVFHVELFPLGVLPSTGYANANDHLGGEWMRGERVPKEEGRFYTVGGAVSINSIYQSMVRLKQRSESRGLDFSNSNSGGGFNDSFRGGTSSLFGSSQQSILSEKGRGGLASSAGRRGRGGGAGSGQGFSGSGRGYNPWWQ